jgi:hypothetical protein
MNAAIPIASSLTTPAKNSGRCLTGRAGEPVFHQPAGHRFRGFTNAAGERINEFRDETGNLLEEATGRASHTWQKSAGEIERHP